MPKRIISLRHAKSSQWSFGTRSFIVFWRAFYAARKTETHSLLQYALVVQLSIMDTSSMFPHLPSIVSPMACHVEEHCLLDCVLGGVVANCMTQLCDVFAPSFNRITKVPPSEMSLVKWSGGDGRRTTGGDVNVEVAVE